MGRNDDEIPASQRDGSASGCSQCEEINEQVFYTGWNADLLQPFGRGF